MQCVQQIDFLFDARRKINIKWRETILSETMDSDSFFLAFILMMGHVLCYFFILPILSGKSN